MRVEESEPSVRRAADEHAGDAVPAIRSSIKHLKTDKKIRNKSMMKYLQAKTKGQIKLRNKIMKYLKTKRTN